ncbi:MULTISPECIES: hypothetical protein [unclassified Novosphingobium]|uniref:hypothetical protein n=1 Tax=unclassified Novosphingobium TaxID=2644732 RepID=UPI000BD1ED9E|nr:MULTISPECIES: hypothetical protein [unclassified Novosphingobium]OYW47906.1 MAG: hypothetical protein B7Z36_01295 [Novosphingobium sp. 12-63-9]HQS71026.1 hypothetical protein [Novosphingobium sp.]
MSLRPCLPGLVNEGKISQEQADRAGALFDELQQDLRRQFGDQAADAMATEATLKAMAAEAARKKFLAAQTIKARQRIEADLRGYGGGRNGGTGNAGRGGGGGPIDPRAGPAMLGGDGRATYSNVEGRWRAVRGRAHAMIDKLLADHSSNVLGQVRNPAQLADVVREAFGEATGNLNARELADAWGRTAEMLRQRFNAAGGDIGKLDKWGLPQTHDSRAVRAAGYEAWRAEILPRLSLEKMIDNRTGRAFTPQSLELALRDVFETIRSDGWKDRAPGGMGSGALANRRGDARFLIFKSADDWMAYADKFGAGSAFDAMMGHIDGMSRDVAMLEVLGPNPANTVEWMKDLIRKDAEMDAAPNSKAVDKARPQLGAIDRMWNELTGASNRAENRQLALVMSNIRALQTATKLGSAPLSAISDLGFQRSRRALNGLRQTNIITDYIKLMKPGALEDQRMAVRRGLIAEEWSSRTLAQNRYMGEELTGEVSRRLAEGVLKVSGLSRFTQAGRWAFGMEFLGTLTEQRGKAFGALDPALRGVMERYGFTAADWDGIRNAPVTVDRGVETISPVDMADQQLGDRLLEMIARETDHAVPVPDLRVKAEISAVAPKGTIAGEIIRSGFLFKGFGLSVLLMQSRSIMAMSAGNAAKYAAGLVIGTTLMGALSLQLKALANGKDPRDMTTPEFWGAALLQGGGFGIFGDFLQSSTNAYGSGFAETLAGPIVSDAQKLVNIANSANPERDTLKFLRSQLPGGSLWYAKTAFDRLVTDQIQRAIDPNYDQSWQRMSDFAREQGTDFWWAPGDAAPGRAPNFQNAIEPAEGELAQ